MANATETYTDPLGQTRKVTFKSVDIGRHNKGVIVLPEKLTEEEAVYWLSMRVKEQNQQVAVNERIPGYPVDVAHALGLACMEMFGFRELKNTGMFGQNPPQFITVPTDHKGGTVNVFIGKFTIPGTEGAIQSGRDFNDALVIAGKLRQKDLAKLKDLISLTKEKLRSDSLFKGKAFRVHMEEQTEGFPPTSKQTMANPEFLDVDRLPANLILKDMTTKLIRASLWTPIRQSDRTRERGVKLRRGILLFGAFGTGKTLTAFQTAKLCQENGWTFIYVNNVKELQEMYRFAARYAPAVVFAEDIDRVVTEHGESGVNMLNNVLDGLDTKNSEVISVLTTNFIEKLPQSLMRPGRFHTIVEYEKPDAQVAARLVEQFAADDLDLADYDAELIGAQLDGQIPATIAEVVQRAKLFSIDRNVTAGADGAELKLTTEDLLASAYSMRTHMEILNRKPKRNPSMIEAFGERLGEALVTATYAAQEKLSLHEQNSDFIADMYHQRVRGTLRHQERAILEPSTELDPEEAAEAKAGK